MTKNVIRTQQQHKEEARQLNLALAIPPLDRSWLAEDEAYSRSDALDYLLEQLERKSDELVVRFFVHVTQGRGRQTDATTAAGLLAALRANFTSNEEDGRVMGRWYFLRIALEHIDLDFLEKLTGYSAEREQRVSHAQAMATVKARPQQQ